VKVNPWYQHGARQCTSSSWNSLRPRAAQLFPEVQAGWLDAELDTASTREWDPLEISDADKAELRADILPFWKGKTIAERLFAQCPPETARLIYQEPGLWPTKSTGIIDNYSRLFAQCPPETARLIYQEPGLWPTKSTGIIDNYSLIQKGIGTVVPNYRKVLECGVNGIIRQIDARTAALDLSNPEDVQRRLFLESARLALNGLVGFAEESDPVRKAELLRIQRACSWVPANPPRNFHEAVQSFWFTHLAVRIEESGHSLSPGRFDQYMLPYLGEDEDRGLVLELLECLMIKFSELMLFANADTSKFYTGVPQWQNLNLGGRLPDGRDATNELSYLCLQAMINMRVVQPDISVRIHADTPEDFLRKACELSRLGTGHPKFYNEDLIAYSLACKGLSIEESRDFAIMGCVEPRVQAKEGIHLTGGFINLPAALELALNDGVWRRTGKRVGLPTGDARKFRSFDEVKAAYEAQLSHMIRHMFVVNAIAENAYSELGLQFRTRGERDWCC